MSEWRVLESESEHELPRVVPGAWRVGMNCKGLFFRTDGLKVIMSVEQKEGDPRKWLHVSLSRRNRLPSRDDVREVKDIFVGRKRKAIQVLPSEDEYINDNPYVLHLWCCLSEDVLPDFRRKGTL